MPLLVMWKKEEAAVFKFEGGEKERVTDETKVEKVFNSKMAEIFQGNNVEELVRGMFAHLRSASLLTTSCTWTLTFKSWS